MTQPLRPGQVRHFADGSGVGRQHDRSGFIAWWPDGRYLRQGDNMTVISVFDTIESAEAALAAGDVGPGAPTPPDRPSPGRIDEAQVAEWVRLAEAASPPPWVAVNVQTHLGPRHHRWHAAWDLVRGKLKVRGTGEDSFDFEFAAAARLAVPALAAALAAERAKVKELARTCGCLDPGENGKPACDPPCIACAALSAPRPEEPTVARRKKKADPDASLALIELRLATMSHAAALKAVIRPLEAGNLDAATARLEGAVTALHATIRGQVAGVTMACPKCGSKQDVVAWVDDGKCGHCGGVLEIP